MNKQNQNRNSQSNIPNHGNGIHTSEELVHSIMEQQKRFLRKHGFSEAADLRIPESLLSVDQSAFCDPEKLHKAIFGTGTTSDGEVLPSFSDAIAEIFGIKTPSDGESAQEDPLVEEVVADDVEDDDGMTPEQRLLYLVFHGDHSTTEDDYALRADRLYATLNKEFDPSQPLTVGDLTAVSRKFAQRVLTYAQGRDKIIGNQVCDEGDCYTWTIKDGVYRPSFTFVVYDYTPLYFDEYGFIYELAGTFQAREFLAEYGINFHGNMTSLLMCKYDHKTNRLEPTTDFDATHVMVEVSWGGPQSTTRGINTQKDIDVCGDYPTGKKYAGLDVETFRKAGSKGGGQGYDFYILPLEQSEVDLRKALIWSQKEHHLDQASEMWMLKLKLETLEKLRKMACFNTGVLEGALAEYQGLNEHCAHHKNCAGPCTITPFYQLDLAELQEVHPCNPAEFSLDMKYDELQDRYELASASCLSEELDCRLAKIRAEIGAWDHFAPLYNLARRQVQSLNGYLEVRPTYTYLRLPSLDSDMVALERKFYYSATQFKEFCYLLEQYANNEAESAKISAAKVQKLQEQNAQAEAHENETRVRLMQALIGEWEKRGEITPEQAEEWRQLVKDGLVTVRVDIGTDGRPYYEIYPVDADEEDGSAEDADE